MQHNGMTPDADLDGGIVRNDDSGGVYGDNYNHNNSHHPPPPQQQHDDDDDDEMFSQSISDGLMAVEELRQFLITIQQLGTTTKVALHTLQIFQSHMNHIWNIVSHLQHHLLPTFIDNNNNNNSNDTSVTNQMLLNHVIQKAIGISQQVLQYSYSNYVEPSGNEAENDDNEEEEEEEEAEAGQASLEERRRMGQGCMARMTEINILLVSYVSLDTTKSNGNNSSKISKTDISGTVQVLSSDDIVQLYVQFQKRTLRLRCKPHIAQLVQIRRDSKDVFDSVITMIIHNTTTTSDAVTTTDHTQFIQETNNNRNNNVTGENNNNNDDDDDDSAAPVVDLSTFTAKVKQQQLSQQTYHTYHSPVFTIILGTAATLIHPLMSWISHLSSSTTPTSTTIPQVHSNMERTQQLNTSKQYLYQMCQQSIDIINEQTQTLVQTMNDWFFDDRKSLMDCCIQLSNNDIVIQPSSTQVLLGHLNAMVDEMAYIAQILERYQSLVTASRQQQHHHDAKSSEPISTISKEILPEWIWQYSTYERILILQQWQRSITSGSAVPVCIVIGTEIKVSSCIEDAQYISTRTMDRSISTQSIDAISTVAYTIIHDIWSTDHDDKNNHESHSSPTNHTSSCAAVYLAIMDEIGCWSAESTTESHGNDGTKKKVASAPSSGSHAFASALLDALDDDLGPANNNNSIIKTPMKAKAPSSGSTNFLSSLILSSTKANEHDIQRQFDTLYCVLNSMYAASGACQTLANTLNDILLDYHDNDDNLNGNTQVQQQQHPPSSTSSNAHHALNEAPPRTATTTTFRNVAATTTTEIDTVTKKAIAKIQLTRDDVLQYATEYQQLLLNRLNESIDRWCYNETNQCLLQLEYFFRYESYHITDSTTFQNMEHEERLQSKLIVPLQQSVLLQQFTAKCDTPVLLLLAEQIAKRVVDMILQILWSQSRNSSDTNDIATTPTTSKKFTDWGALLLSKQSRMLQQYISTTMIQQQQPPSTSITSSSTISESVASLHSLRASSGISSPKVIQTWERLSHVITVLQLEKPMDWITYYHSNNVSTNNSSSILTHDELSQTLHLRVDFSSDAIEAVVSKLRHNGGT